MTTFIQMTLSFAILMILFRIITFYLHISSIEESSSKIIFIEKPWYLMYSAYKIDPSENYNWTKIKADIRKGVDPLLAVQREFVVFLEIEMFNLNDNHKNLLVSKQDGKLLLKKYETVLAEQLLMLEQLEAQQTLKEGLDILGKETFQELLDSFNKELDNED